jgi:hypothetical protein
MNPQELPLRDLHLPELTSWWPLAPGWWFVGALLLLGLALLLRRVWRRWKHNSARRLALRRLQEISAEFEHGSSAATLGKELSELTRRAMLAYAPRSAMAGLTGNDWLEWLDQGLDDEPFSKGSGRILESLPYMNPDVIDNDTDVRGLIDAVRLRLERPMTEVRS